MRPPTANVSVDEERNVASVLEWGPRWMVGGTVFVMWLGGHYPPARPLAQVLWRDKAEERNKGHGGAVPIVHPVTTRPVRKIMAGLKGVEA